MPADRVFLDSNVVLYSLGSEIAKKHVTLLACTPLVSTQCFWKPPTSPGRGRLARCGLSTRRR